MVTSINHCAINTCPCLQPYLLSIRNAVVVVSNSVVNYNLCRFYNTVKPKILINMEILKKLKGDLSFHLYLIFISVHLAKVPRKHTAKLKS